MQHHLFLYLSILALTLCGCPADESDDDSGAADDDDTTAGDDDDTTAGDDDDLADDDSAGDDDDSAQPEDADGDGWAAAHGDCDDNDPEIHPEAEDLPCDGIDANCDGVDAGLDDADGDGYSICDGDCDDTTADASPEGTEVCGDGLDNDCDGLATGCYFTGTFGMSDADLAITDSSLSGLANDFGIEIDAGGDINGDGYDDLLIAASSHGMTSDGAVYIAHGPFTTGTLDVSMPEARMNGDYSDFLGRSLAFAGDMNADGYDDMVVSARGQFADNGSRGTVFVVHGPVSNEFGYADAEASFTGEETADEAGNAVAGAGDINGDGYDDVLIGAYEESSAGHRTGAVYVLYGPVTPGDSDLSTADVKLTGLTDNALFGYSLAPLGDTNGDGMGDFASGAERLDPAINEFDGGGHFFLGPPPAAADTSSADALLIGAAHVTGDVMGTAGDHTFDGIDDLLMTSAHSVYLVPSPPSGDVALTDSTTVFFNSGVEGAFGDEISGGGDVNQDGHADILIGSQFDPTAGTSAGAAYLFHGPVAAGEHDAAAADATFLGEMDSAFAATAISIEGDLNADGFDDVVISARDVTYWHTVFVFFGRGW